MVKCKAFLNNASIIHSFTRALVTTSLKQLYFARKSSLALQRVLSIELLRGVCARNSVLLVCSIHCVTSFHDLFAKKHIRVDLVTTSLKQLYFARKSSLALQRVLSIELLRGVCARNSVLLVCSIHCVTSFHDLFAKKHIRVD